MKYYFLALATLVVLCVGCAIDGQQVVDRGENYAPPAAMMQRPGPMVDGPGPGVMPMYEQASLQAAQPQLTQVRFVGPEGMSIGWQVQDRFLDNQLIAPARYSFMQAATYRLKLSSLPGGREGLVLYPTLQVYPAQPVTSAYLAHSNVPIQITDEDLDQVEANNFVTKVIYLPDAKYQELAVAGVEELVSTRLDPGVDPVSEADRRGTIMAVLRMGNLDMEMPGSTGPISAITAAHGEGIEQTAYMQDAGAPPTPIGPAGPGAEGVPSAMVVGGSGLPGMPAPGPVAGENGIPVWGMPSTGTPIGLAGPPSIPLGGPASLKSYTVRNLTKQELPKPVDHMLLDVKHEPGFRLPPPVKHIQYTERHPEYGPDEVNYPKYAVPPTP